MHLRESEHAAAIAAIALKGFGSRPNLIFANADTAISSACSQSAVASNERRIMIEKATRAKEPNTVTEPRRD